MAVPVFTTGSAVLAADLNWMARTKPAFFGVAGVTATTLVANVATPIALDTIFLDRGAGWSGANPTRYVMKELGYYRVNGSVTLTAGVATIGVIIHRNGTALSFSDVYTYINSASGTASSSNLIWQATATTDYLELCGFQPGPGNFATSINGAVGLCSLAVEYLGT